MQPLARHRDGRGALNVAGPARGALGLPLLALTAAGLVVAGYLSFVRMAGESPVCGPGGGCETVATSSYATLFGVLPVAFLGVAASLVLVACAWAWWRTADRRWLLMAYGLLLAASVFVAYLTYLELFVIHAVCTWCVTYAAITVAALVVAGLALRRQRA